AAKGNDGSVFNIENVKGGDVLRATVWIKASNLVPDSAAKYPDTWSVGFTYGFFKGNENNVGFNSVDGYPKDMSFKFPAVNSFDWTPYSFDFTVPNTPDAKALEIRLHIYSRFTGTVYFDDLQITNLSIVSGTQYADAIPTNFTVFQNYPNPFNPSTRISYSIPTATNVTIKVYDMLGNEVITLLNEEQTQGMHTMNWNGVNAQGSKVATGTYIYSVKAGNQQTHKKMILLK
ncbi:MAG: T9SS type A sorting domain-containing protein, partial [Ignavibacteriales bacterium]|nr:T9SS type A sorting domain-containing protein [Ignavibacteriales bacterium]